MTIIFNNKNEMLKKINQTSLLFDFNDDFSLNFNISDHLDSY